MASLNYSPFLNWLPYNLFFRHPGESYCKWQYISNKLFTEPFFQDTVSFCRSNNSFDKSSVSSIKFMQQHSVDIEYINPTAFIFHVSRCGSTLVSQLLSLGLKSIVLSEVPFLDEILRAPYKEKKLDFDIGEAFTSALKFYGQKREGNEEYLFVKTDSWHVCFYQKLRQLYPQVPFIFLYRSPTEVIRSQQKRRGMHSVPGVIEKEIFGFNLNEVGTNLDHYLAKVLERYFTLFIEIIKNDRVALLLNYNEGISTIIEKILAFTDYKITSDEAAKMEIRSRYHGKYPEEKFAVEEGALQELPYLKESTKLYNQLDMLR